MSYRLIDANALNNKISTEDYEIIMKEPEVFADLPSGLDGGFYIAVPAHEGMTNGDMLTTIFPDLNFTNVLAKMYAQNGKMLLDWWNAQYKGTEG